VLAALSVLLAVGVAGCAEPVGGSASAVDAVDLPAVAGVPGRGVTPPPADAVGRLLEGIRLAAVTPNVQEVFPDREPECVLTGALTDPGRIEVESLQFLPGTVTPVLEKYGFVASWRACATFQLPTQPIESIAHSFELADPASARAAAAELAAASLRTGERELTVLGGARAQLNPVDDREAVEIWVPVGRTLSYVFHEAAAGVALGEATRLAEAHARLLAAFVPTPQADVPALPPDPTGLKGITAIPLGDPDLGTGPYDLAATLHESAAPGADRALLTANGYLGSYRKWGFDGERSHRVTVDAFAGPEQVAAVRDAYVAAEAARPGRAPYALRAVPAATCFVFDRSFGSLAYFSHSCYVSGGSQLATVEVLGSAALDDTAALTALVGAQLDLIAG
jgi:hypothetical protein